MRVANENIFESPSQRVNIDPNCIKLVWDRVLVRDIKDSDKIGSIWIPDTAAERGMGKKGLLRMGIVVAIGPGDPWASEKVITARKGDVMAGSHVERKALGVCDFPGLPFRLNGEEKIGPPCEGGEVFDIVNYERVTCPRCKGDGIRRWPMYCKIGDYVCYDRRKEAEIFIDGERLSLIHEEQSVLGIIEGVAREV